MHIHARWAQGLGHGARPGPGPGPGPMARTHMATKPQKAERVQRVQSPARKFNSIYIYMIKVLQCSSHMGC